MLQNLDHHGMGMQCANAWPKPRQHSVWTRFFVDCEGFVDRGCMISFITDCEGDYQYWSRCVALSEVVEFNSQGSLSFKRRDAQDSFVFGGDVFDKGLGDLRIAGQLVEFKKSHPDRVWLLAGNRDLNKLRFPAELAEDEIDVPQPVPLYPRAPPQVSLRSFLEKQLDGEDAGKTVDDVNTQANRLRWILDHTMTATGAFELRRQEMAILSGKDAGAVSDDEVVSSFLESVAQARKPSKLKP